MTQHSLKDMYQYPGYSRDQFSITIAKIGLTPFRTRYHGGAVCRYVRRPNHTSPLKNAFVYRLLWLLSVNDESGTQREDLWLRGGQRGPGSTARRSVKEGVRRRWLEWWRGRSNVCRIVSWSCIEGRHRTALRQICNADREPISVIGTIICTDAGSAPCCSVFVSCTHRQGFETSDLTTCSEG